MDVIMKTSKIVLSSLLILLWIQPGIAQSIVFKQFTLKNGLRVILSEDHAAPTYSVAVTYNAGSRDEREGKTGFAHLFEHMMFQGSENVGKGEHMIIVENNGGEANGNTTNDRTAYFETLPSNQIDLGLYIEADRMRSLVINQANLDNQRKTVQEERRERYDNQPYGKTFEAVIDLTYDNFAYKHSTIGSMKDLDMASVKDVADFFRTYYAPNNAVLTMVGDFKTDEALAKIQKYFEDIPKQTPPPVPNMTEPKQSAERRKTIEDPLADADQVDIVYKIPAGNTPDWYALSVAGLILSQGTSSRFYQELVKDKRIVQGVSADAEERRGPSLFWISATLNPDKDPKEVEKLIYADLERLKKEPVSDIELEKVRMLVRRSGVEQLESTQGRATNLGESTVFYNDPSLVNTWPEKYLAVTKAKIQEVAKKYFVVSNRTVVTTVPKEAPEPAARGGK
jgi:predicted Zn-dependent peptidase